MLLLHERSHRLLLVEKPPTVTIDDLRNWYNAADKLGKPENYKKRIVEVANGFKAGEQLSAQALMTVMNKDTFELEARVLIL